MKPGTTDPSAPRRRPGALGLALSALVLGLLFIFSVSPALAGTVTNDRPLLFSFDGSDSSIGPFTYTGAVATDEVTGDVYVINLAGEGKGEGPEQEPAKRVVCKFDAEGKAQAFSATGKSCLDPRETAMGHAFGVEGFFGTGSFTADVAVDNSGGSGGPGEGEQGRLYVSEEDGPIHAFAPSGAYLWTLPRTTARPCGIAVDAAGHLWVGNGFDIGEAGEKVLEFDTTGAGPPPSTPIGGFKTTQGGEPCRLAIDKNGQDTYVGVRGNSRRAIDKYVAGVYDSTLANDESVDLTIDQSKLSGHVFALSGDTFAEYEPCETPNCPGTAVAGSPFGGDLLSRVRRGIAYNPTKDWVYVSDLESETVKVFGPVTSGAVPDVTTGETGEITQNEATAHGTINPQGLPNAYRFEYRRCENETCSGSRDVNTRWATAKSSAPQSIEPTDGIPHAVSIQLEGLSRNFTYQVRLVGTNTEPGKNLLSAYSTPDTFKTLPPPVPTVACAPISAITTSSAHLACAVDPQEDQAAWRVLRSAQPGATEAECKARADSEFKTVKEGTIPTGEPGSVEIEADLTGLLPAQTNCVRVIATNAGGPGKADLSFRTEAVPPSELETAFAAPRTDTAARINARINPEGEEPPTYRFELSGDGVNWTPLSPHESAVAAWEPIVVADELKNLTPNTTYHYRLASAGNEAGSAAGPGEERTFTTRTTAEMALPPNALGEPEKRGIELVNNPDDGNVHVRMLGTLYGEGYTAISPDGEKAVWEVLSGAPGAPNGAENWFLAERMGSTESAPNGWSSRPIAPPAEQQYGGGGVTPTIFAATPDLSQFVAVFGGEFESALTRFDQSRNQHLLKLFPNLGVSRQASFNGKAVDMTDDGAHVLVQNEETGQIEDDDGGAPEVVSLMPDGTESECHMGPEGASFVGTDNSGRGAGRYWRPGYHMIATTDASRVYFQVKPNGSGCGAGVPLALYVRNREAGKGKGKTTLIDPGTASSEPHFIRATTDGRGAYFVTASKLDPVDENNHEDVYLWEEKAGKSRCLTCEAAVDADLSSAQKGVVVSGDFSHVYFESKEALAPGALAGGLNIYALSGAALRFVANVSQSATVNGALQESELSADGNVLVFRAVPQPALTADAVASKCTRPDGGSIACRKLYRYDDRDGSLECLDCVHGGLSSHAGYFDNARLSADGSTVAFTTPEALVPRDVNRDSDLYEWRNGALRLITDGVSVRSAEHTHAVAVDSDGSNIFFTVAAPGLTGFEHNGLANAYDARIGGGFPPPEPKEHCSEESCQGPLQAAPPAGQPGSSTYSGPGNVKEGPHRPSCRRGKVRRHGRCVSRHPHKRRHKRAGGTNRGKAQ